MASNDITSANSVLILGVASVFAVPQQMQGFAADDAYSMDAVENKQTLMGVDGILSAGWVPQIIPMHVMLQADSIGLDFFEAWYAAEQAGQTALKAFGTIRQEALGRTYALTGGFLKSYSPIANAKRVLQPRSFIIDWTSVIGAPL